MSYIPPWVTGAGTGHYPAHMLPPQHSLPTHTQHPPTSNAHLQHTPVTSQHTPTSSHSPHTPVSVSIAAAAAVAAAESHVSHMYQSLSPKTLVNSVSLPSTNGNKSGADHNHQHHINQSVSSPSSAHSSPASVTAVSIANSIMQQQQPPPSTTPNHPAPATTPSHPSNNALDTPYEPQGFHRTDVGSPPPKLHTPDLRHDLRNDLASHLHSLPELALGIPGTSATVEMKAHRKYVRR